jgi:hypothetical protein
MAKCPKCSSEIKIVKLRQDRMLEGECYLDEHGNIDCHVKYDYPDDDGSEYFCPICFETICSTEDDAQRFLRGEDIDS